MHLSNETVEELQNKVDDLKGKITNRMIKLAEIKVMYSCPEKENLQTYFRMICIT